MYNYFNRSKYNHNLLERASVCVCAYMHISVCDLNYCHIFVVCVAVVFVAPFNQAASNSRLFLHIFQKISSVADIAKKRRRRRKEKKYTELEFSSRSIILP